MTEIELLRAENIELRKIAADLSLIVGEIIAVMPSEWQELESVRYVKHINDEIVAGLVHVSGLSDTPHPAGEQDTGEWA